MICETSGLFFEISLESISNSLWSLWREESVFFYSWKLEIWWNRKLKVHLKKYLNYSFVQYISQTNNCSSLVFYIWRLRKKLVFLVTWKVWYKKNTKLKINFWYTFLFSHQLENKPYLVDKLSFELKNTAPYFSPSPLVFCMYREGYIFYI